MTKISRYAPADAKAVESAETVIRLVLEELEQETGKQVAFVTIDAGNLYVEITMLEAAP